LRALIAVCLGLHAGLAGAAGSTDSLVGTWRLVSYTDTPENGAPIRAFGNHPTGQFIFTGDGHVSISIMRNPPDITSASTDRDPDTCLPAWYCAYFGTYEVNYRTNTWVTHVLGGNIPNYIGTDQPRNFALRDDRLVITESYQEGGKTVRAERVLVRESDRPKDIARFTHDAHVSAINSNDTDTLMANLTEDVVYQSPSEPEIIGKDAVRRWVASYFGTYLTHWDKTSVGVTVIGVWAFERYTYKSKDVEKKTGAVTTDTGKGINIFRRGTDGNWRVAVDGWSSDHPAR
jgi:ketosteroid isomerase-like protein